MVNKIIDGISIKLNSTFDDTYKIYSETVRQGFKEPCFFIVVLNPSQVPMLNKRRFRRNLFNIHYFPQDIGSNKEMQEVADKLYNALEWISVDENLVRGVKLNHEVVDGVLHFFVEYNLFIHKVEEQEDPMETLVINNNVKE